MKKIYIYDDPVLMNNWLSYLPNVYDDVDYSIFNSLKNSKFVTYNPEEADIFIIAIPLRKSYLIDRENHKSRILECFDYLFNNKYFIRNNGSDHILLATHWNFSNWCSLSNQLIFPEIWQKLEEVTCTRYEYFRMSKWENMLNDNPDICIPKSLFEPLWEKTKKTILVPYRTTHDVDIVDYNYDNWINRKNLIFYHTRKTGSSHGATKLRHLPIEIKSTLPGSIGYDISKEDWINDFKDSKWSLIIRGDTPSSHSFVNSINFGCIPIVISDLFERVALPFDIKLDDISISISEKDFLNNPNILMEKIENISTNEIKNKINNLKNVQPIILYNHSSNLISDMIINSFF